MSIPIAGLRHGLEDMTHPRSLPSPHGAPARTLGHAMSRPAVLATLGGMAYAALLVLGLAALAASPRFSLEVAVPRAGQARVTWLLPGGSLWDRGVRPGDRVLALDGVPPAPAQAGTWSGRRWARATPPSWRG